MLDLATALAKASAVNPGTEIDISPYVTASAMDNTADISESHTHTRAHTHRQTGCMLSLP